MLSAFSGAKWDAFWWIYIRGEPVPPYSHVGLDVAATLKRQASVADAVTRAINYHPQSFLPMEEDLEDSKAKRKAEAEAAARKRGGSAQNQQSAKKKKIDANANPCHGIVYNGACNRPDCQFDHHVGRCKAYKEAHPDGPPTRR